MKNIPDFRFLQFRENPKRPGIFDLVNDEEFDKFQYFRLEKPRTKRLKSLGVIHVLESWKDGKKVFHSGLKLVQDNYYFGDYVNLIKPGKPSLLIVQFFDNQTIHVWFFNSYSKFSIEMKEIFCREFLEQK